MRRRASDSSPRSRRESSRTPVALTGRGGVVVIFAVGLVGAFVARLPGFALLAGLGFVAGCVLAALATRPADLLTLVVSPPLAFFAVVVVSEFASAVGTESVPRTFVVGLLTTLATTAPWLFLGTLLVVGIAIPRGLPASVRELRGKLAGLRLFHEEENADPVRWDEAPERQRRIPRGDPE